MTDELSDDVFFAIESKIRSKINFPKLGVLATNIVNNTPGKLGVSQEEWEVIDDVRDIVADDDLLREFVEIVIAAGITYRAWFKAVENNEKKVLASSARRLKEEEQKRKIELNHVKTKSEGQRKKEEKKKFNEMFLNRCMPIPEWLK